jgi:hypothetical protein
LRVNRISQIVGVGFIGATAFFAAPAAAQQVCYVTETNLTFQQWYSRCAWSVQQTCATPAMQIFPGCQQMVAQGMYGTYVNSQSMPACAQGTYGAAICWVGFVRRCDGNMWVATAQTC